ncbi:MAG: LytTR family DNA-binding domain-containing protein [Lachnospiraceae bacterium]|nr:LytTR family DNA-binding domain-containing protein [Lachnospiraceae bacterium]
MKIAICDDNERYNVLLRQFLTHYFSCQKIQTFQIVEFQSGVDLLCTFTPALYDLIFLDVMMPELDGFQVAEQIRKMDLHVDLIFVTSMEDQIQKGFDYNAKGYLYKEVHQEQIDTLLNRLLVERKRSDKFYKVRLKGETANTLLHLADILYFEVHNKDIYGFTQNETFTFRGKIAQLEQDLVPKGFLRVHRSYLINQKKIFKNFGNQIVLRGGFEIPLSRKYKSLVQENIKKRWQ